MKNFNSGVYVNQGTYKSFQPEQINKQWQVDNMELQNLLSKADRQIGRLDMYSEYIPNIDLFIRMHIVKEATQSSKIEGTKTNMEEALLEREDVTLEKRNDWEEVQNYITALSFAIARLEDIPFSSRLIRDTHRILLTGVRGKHKLPGEFRRSQNWIGGASLKDATFIPPSFDTVPDYMGDIEKFAHNLEINMPDLLKVGLIHYQFETVHPFLDGNGRVGRLLIILYLVEKGILKKPVLYLSDFFERNRILYYDNLMRTRTHNDITQWFRFFLVGVIETAENSINTFDGILKLQKETEAKIQELGKRVGNATSLLNSLYQNPLTDAQLAQKATGLSLTSAYKLINDFERLGILENTTTGKRNKSYIFNDYLKLFA